jgi:hypothetical protein
MGGADFGQVGVTGEAVFRLAGQDGGQGDRLRGAGDLPPGQQEAEKQEEGGESEEATHRER